MVISQPIELLRKKVFLRKLVGLWKIQV